jgi:hypothetical protein
MLDKKSFPLAETTPEKSADLLLHTISCPILSSIGKELGGSDANGYISITTAMEHVLKLTKKKHMNPRTQTRYNTG